jgi:Type IV secretion-system coupling protein DNA-binding domain
VTSAWSQQLQGTTGASQRVVVEILEGTTVQATPSVAGAEPTAGHRMRAVLRGRHGILRFDDVLLSKHLLFLGGIGTGKTNAMMQLLVSLRRQADPEDVFIIFDSKRDFLDELYQDGDAVITNQPEGGPGTVIWNLFKDIVGGGPEGASDEIYEVASTIFSEGLSAAGDNMFFAAGARDVFAAVFEALTRDGALHDNRDLRQSLEGSTKQLWDLITGHPDLKGTAQYLAGAGNSAQAVRAFLQQAVNTAFSGVFRLPGDFSIRQFVRDKGRRALFVEYDIAAGSRLMPVYRVLLDLAIKEALTMGRDRKPGSVYFVMDEFSLVPQLQHMTDGINFGRSLGLKFIVGTQNVEQVLFSYGPELGRTILSGFGTVLGFRLMDDVSRNFVRQRFGSNRKRLTLDAAVRAQGVQQETLLGNVIEDWYMSALGVGECIASFPTGDPFQFAFDEYRRPA